MRTFFGGAFIDKEKLEEAGIEHPIKLEYYKQINEDDISLCKEKYGICIVKTEYVPNNIKTDSKDYLYPHDYPGAYIYQEYLPKKLKGKRYYHPKTIGYEKNIKSYYDFIENMKKKANH